MFNSKYLNFYQFVSAFAAFLGSLAILDALEQSYFVLNEKIWTNTQFSLWFDPSKILFVLILLLSIYFIKLGCLNYLLFPVFSTLILRGWGLSLGLGLSCIFLVCVFLYYNRELNVFFFWLLCFLTGFELLAVFHWMFLYPLRINILSRFVIVEIQLFYLTVQFSTLLYLLIIVYSIIVFVFKRLSSPEPYNKNIEETSKLPLFPLALLCISGVLMAGYPYLGSVNPFNNNLGIDLKDYIVNLDSMSSDPLNAFRVKEGSRPTIYLLLWGVQSILGLDSVLTVRVIYILLNILMVLSAYFFANTMFNDKKIALLGSFFTLFGFPVVVGMSAGFLANMLAIVFQNLSLGLLFSSIGKKSGKSLAGAILFGILVSLTHPWTFDQYTGVVAILAISEILRHRVKILEIIEAKFVITYVLVLGLGEFIRSFLIKGIGGSTALGELIGGFTSLSSFWEGVNLSTWTVYGGLFGSCIILFPVLYALVSLNMSRIEEYYLSLFMFSTSIIWLVGNAIIKDRLLYNTPLWLLSSFGTVSILRGRESEYLEKIIMSFIIIAQVNYALRGFATLI